MTLPLPGSVVSAQWLQQHLQHPDVIICDATWFIQPERNGYDEFCMERISGSRYFDYNETICDTVSPLPRMMPTPQVFEQEVRKLGISNNHAVIVYDRNKLFSSRARLVDVSVYGSRKHCCS